MEGAELSHGVSYEDLKDPLAEKFAKQLGSIKNGFVKLQPYNQVFPKEILKYEKQIREFAARPDDVWIASFPKCGTTWTLEMVWCIMNNYDFSAAKEKNQEERMPYFEVSALMENAPMNSLEIVASMESPRLIKTHLSFDMLPKTVHMAKPKVVYVTRNPRDTCVSYYNFLRVSDGYTGSFEDFAESMLNDMVGYYSPFFVHVLSYWHQRHLPNVCFVTYEEMKADLPSVVSKVASFLGKPLPGTQGEMEAFLDHLSFDKMKSNAAVNKADLLKECRQALGKDENEEITFMRKGHTGDWKNHFKSDLVAKFEEWEGKGLEGSDLQFTYEM